MSTCTLENDNTTDILIRQLKREVKAFYDDTTAKLLLHDGKIAELCNYVKTNLSNSIRELLDTMEASGELSNIITDTILSEISTLELKSNHIINVKEFGAYGDGKHDDTNAINMALSFFKDENKKIIFPEGVYLVQGDLLLYSNTEIDFNNATIKAAGTTLIKNNDLTGLSIGYGSLRNIKFNNGYFTSDNNSIIKIALIHADNVTANNLIFDNCMYGNHVFDLGGCTNIKIQNCHFKNVKLRNPDTYVELIQIEYAAYNGMPYWNQDSIVYDALPSKNIEIANCTFEKGENGTHYPNAIGGHGVLSGQHENIYIHGCRFNGWTYAAIRPLRAKNITISNNYFETEDNEGTLPAIYIESGSNISYPFISSENILIGNNIFISKAESKRRFIFIYGESSEKLHNRIIINSNIYKGTYNINDDSSGADFIQLDYVKNVNISNNIAENAKNFAYQQTYSEGVNFNNNKLNNCRTFRTASGNHIENNYGNSCITVSPDEFTGSTIEEEKLILKNVVAKAGEGFEISEGSILIKKGISQIKISALLNVKTPSSQGSIHSISIKRTRKGSTVSLAEARFRPEGNYETLTIPTKLLNVEENDIFSFYVQSSTVGEVISNASYLTIESI